MSFTQYECATVRLQRSELAVPGSNQRMIEKAALTAADYVFLDCEDAVAPAEKAQARSNIVTALNQLDWRGKSVSVRINGLDTHFMYRDVVDIVEQAGAKLDTILIPKDSQDYSHRRVTTLVSVRMKSSHDWHKVLLLT